MAIIQSNESERNEDLALGPGKRLREARIARNLAVEDVATRLRLHIRTIKSIEADDYVALPAPTFVRGYLRGYARLLDLPCGPIVESYSRNDFAPPPLVPDISKREEIKSTDFPVRMVTYAIAGALIIFVTIWWQNQRAGPITRDDGGAVFAAPTSAMPTSAAPTSATPTSDLETDFSDLEIAEPPEDALPETALENEVIPLLADDTEGLGLASDSTDAVDTVAAVAEIGSEVEPVELIATDSDGAPVDENISAVETVASEPGINHLKMAFSHESWVEIYGGNDKTLFYNLAKPGSIIELSESGPFRVLLGFAQGVEVEYNGSAFDVSEHTTAGIARFTLDKTEPAPAIAESQFLPQSSQQQ